MRKYVFSSLTGTVALAIALAVTTPARAGTTDAWVTTKVKMALLTSDGVSSTAVNVDTIDGRVTLHGTVGSAAEKDAATRAAQTIAGVREVRNLLAVVPPPAASRPARRCATAAAPPLAR